MKTEPPEGKPIGPVRRISEEARASRREHMIRVNARRAMEIAAGTYNPKPPKRKPPRFTSAPKEMGPKVPQRRVAKKTVTGMVVPVYLETARLGPKMLALPNDRWRAFVMALLHQGNRNLGKAYIAAGYKSEAKRTTIFSSASKLAHDPRIIAALREEAENHVHTAQLVTAIRAVDDILASRTHRDRAKVALSVYDRAGLHAVSEQKVTVERLDADPARLDRIKLMLEQLGVGQEGLKKLLGNRLASLPPPPEITEAEYEEVPQ